MVSFVSHLIIVLEYFEDLMKLMWIYFVVIAKELFGACQIHFGLLLNVNKLTPQFRNFTRTQWGPTHTEKMFSFENSHSHLNKSFSLRIYSGLGGGFKMKISLKLGVTGPSLSVSGTVIFNPMVDKTLRFSFFFYFNIWLCHCYKCDLSLT